MNFAPNEFTIQSLIAHLNKKHGAKKSGHPFNKNDISQYVMRGHLPYCYGGNTVTRDRQHGIIVFTIGKSVEETIKQHNNGSNETQD